MKSNYHSQQGGPTKPKEGEKKSRDVAKSIWLLQRAKPPKKPAYYICACGPALHKVAAAAGRPAAGSNHWLILIQIIDLS